MFKRQSKPFGNGLFWVAGTLFVGLLFLIFSKIKEKQSKAIHIQPEIKIEDRSGLSPSEQFFAAREYPDYKTDAATYREAMREAAQKANIRGSFKGFTAPWSVQGPANIGARINSVAVHPSNPDVIYIGYSVGGLWKTTNGGQSWVPIFDDQAFTAIGDIAFHPTDPNTIFVGTGDPNISAYPFLGDGIWKSTDAGQTWTNIGLQSTFVVSEIRTHPSNPDIIYAATMGLPFERNPDRGLYKTTDGGANWQKILYIGTETGIIDMVLHPTNPDIIYAAAWDRIRNNSESVVSGVNAKIWKSTNGGSSWETLDNGLPTDSRSRIGLSINPSNPDQLVAVYVGTDLYLDDIYKTTNGGQSWSPVPGNGLDENYMSNFGWYFGKIAHNPFNPNQLWALGVYTQRSDNGGISWSEAFDWDDNVHVDHHDIAFINATTFLIATDGGLYKSSDNGGSWAKIENIPTTQFYRTAWNPHSPEYYYGGAQDNGTVTGNKTGLNAWWSVNGGDGFQAVFHPNNPDIHYYEYQNGGIVGTTDGYEYNNATDGIEQSDRRSWDMQYMISPNDPNVMLTGTYRLYRSETHMPYWFAVSDDLTDGINNRYHVITTLDESPLAANLTYVGTSDGNVWQGNSLSGNFTKINTGLPNRYISCVKASPSNANRVFVAATGYKDNDFSPHIFKSNNKGAVWQSIAGDLPNFAVNDILILPGHNDSLIFLATDGGVYGTANGGNSWERLGSGMPIVPVYDLSVNDFEQTLFAGTFARSIMSFPLDSLHIDGDVSTFTPTENQASSFRVRAPLNTQQLEIVVHNMKAEHSSEIFITDLSGNIRYRTNFSKDKHLSRTIEIGNWPSGVYVAFIRTQGKLWAQEKFMKF